MIASTADGGSTLALIGLVFGVGIGVQVLASLLRLPALVLLLAAGVLLGPVFGVITPGGILGQSAQPVISAGVALVLFEGGLSLRLREARMAGPVLWRLILSGLLLGFILTTLAAMWLADLGPVTAATLGAILVVTGPTVILPMLRQARIAMRPATLLKWEGIVNDPLGALLAVLVLQIAMLSPEAGESLGTLLPGYLLRFVAAAGLGALAGVLLGLGLREHHVSEHLRSPSIFAAVLVVHALGEYVGEENGLLAVTVMGLTLANRPDTHLHDVLHFKEQVTVLLVSVLFVVLSARLRLEDVQALWGAPLLLVLAVPLLVRPLVVAAATWRSGLPWSERLLLSWICPRGVVAAAVAGAFAVRLRAAGYADAGLLVPVVFGVIVVTVVLQGFSIGVLARRLGLSTVDGNGVLIVGASTWVTALADALQRAGASVVLADDRYSRVSRARREGLEAWFGDVLGAELDLELPMERISWVLAATGDDHFNRLCCVHFGKEVGRERVLQTTPDGPGSGPLIGRTPWGVQGSYRRLAGAYWLHRQVRVTKLSVEYGFDRLRQDHPRGIALFLVEEGRVAPIDSESAPEAGAVIVHLQEVPSWADDEGAQDDAQAEPASELGSTG